MVDAPAEIRSCAVEGTSADLNISSIIEEIVVVFEILDQGRSYVESTIVVVGEELIAVSPSNEAEVVI